MKIIRKTKGFEPPVDTLLNYFDFEDKKLMESNPRANKNGAIIFTPSALEELDRHIMWGQRNYRNLVEVVGYLVGTVIRTQKNDKLVGICEHVIPLRAEGTGTFVEGSAEAGFEGMEAAKRVIEKSGKDYRIIGWYHTHPGSLPVFMSGTDVSNQLTLFPAEWHFAVVFNPQQKIWRAFRGPKILEVNGILACDAKSVFLAGGRSSGAKKFMDIYSRSEDYAERDPYRGSPKAAEEQDEGPQESVEEEAPAPDSPEVDIRSLAESIYRTINISNDIENLCNVCLSGRGRVEVSREGDISFVIGGISKMNIHLIDKSKHSTFTMKTEPEENPENGRFIFHFFVASVSFSKYVETFSAKVSEDILWAAFIPENRDVNYMVIRNGEQYTGKLKNMRKEK